MIEYFLQLANQEVICQLRSINCRCIKDRAKIIMEIEAGLEN
jgi:hypothetical protein